MMTVAELIQKLSTMDPTLEVLMSMNNEYTSPVTVDMVVEGTAADGTPIVYIDDCLGD
jgi:hypothetical protein